MLLLGIFASPHINPAIAVTVKQGNGFLSLAGGPAQFLNQLKGVLFTMVFAAATTWVLLKLVDRTVGLRVTEEDESLGLDLTQHGENAYND
jgi:Amt family ammonium transporter